jgi:hypothetical protein
MKKTLFEEGHTIYDGYWILDIGISIFPISNDFPMGLSKRRFFIFLLLTSYLFIFLPLFLTFVFFFKKKKNSSTYIEQTHPF